MRYTYPLLAAVLGTTAFSAHAETFVYRSQPEIIERAPSAPDAEVPAQPSTLAFTPVADLAAGSTVLSEILPMSGYGGRTMSIGSEFGELRLCADGSCSVNSGWGRSQDVGGETHLQLRVVAAGAGESRAVSVLGGPEPTQWNIASAARAEPTGEIGDVYTIPEMALDSDTISMLAAWLGAETEWTLCATELHFQPVYEGNCLGAANTLTVVRWGDSRYSFGAYVNAPAVERTSGARSVPGYYFSSAPAFNGRKYASNGTWTAAAMSTVQHEPGGYGFIPFYTVVPGQGLATYDRNGEWRPNPRMHITGQSGPATTTYAAGTFQLWTFRR